MQQRGAIQALTRLLASIEEDRSSQRTKTYLRNQIAAINDYWCDISTGHKKIMSHTNQYDYDSNQYFQIEQRYLKTKIELEEQLEASTAIPQCKLPKITLPTFDGSYLKWKQFQDLFLQLIHNQPIGAAQKMFYLKANLSGEPSKLIRHLQATDKNYELAWSILLDRYDNKRSIITALLNELLSQPSLTNESSSGLKRLHDTTKECLLAVGNLNIDTATWDPIILHILLQKLDRNSRCMYEQSLTNPRDIQTLERFFLFLDMRFHQLETVSSKEDRKRSLAFVTATSDGVCYACKATGHKIFDCKSFLKKSAAERIQTVKQYHLCMNCLKPNHGIRECKSRNCSKCGLRHNTLIHGAAIRDGQRQIQGATTKLNNNKQEHLSKPFQAAKHTTPSTSRATESDQINQYAPQSAVNTSSLKTSINQPVIKSRILLATAVIEVITPNGVPMTCRVLLDSGSQLHFITERLVHELGLRRIRISLPISGIGGTETVAHYETSLTIKSRLNNFCTQISAVILPKISDFQPSSYINTAEWDIPPHIQLADPTFFKPQGIDMLLGAELYFSLLLSGQLKSKNNLPIFQNTKLGWILAGSIPGRTEARLHCNIATQPSIASLERQVQQFWEIDQHDAPKTHQTHEDQECEAHFSKNFKRTECGQFIVKLPFRKSPSELGSSFHIAEKRFYALEKKLLKSPETWNQYCQFMAEYESLGHMQKISVEELPPSNYFLPHHCVMKPDSTTTKLRVVFDASAKSSSGVSLNDILMVGPTVQPDLFSIIMRARQHKYLMTADISKMYRQIRLHDEHQQYQLILWRDQKQNSLEVYKLKTVTYGTASAPYLATRCLKQLAIDEYECYPEAAGVLLNDTYVDDIIAGANSVQEMVETKNQLVSILKRGHFELRKFCSNHPDILSDVPAEHKEALLQIHNTDVIKTLGLIWEPTEDVFRYTWSQQATDKITKRTVLSDVARLFDPLGLIGPVVTLAKAFVQDLWKVKLSWDDELPLDLKTKWERYKEQLTDLANVKVPRHCVSSKATEIQLHAFSDSSERAYGACIYLRSLNQSGTIRVRLLCSKSRLAPLKATTLARLELCGALLMAELVDRIITDLTININKVCYYTDSTTVLAWIAAPSYQWTTFVANRVAKIQALTRQDQWHYVQGSENPADIISRGALPREIARSDLWFKGPKFLSISEASWRTTPTPVPSTISETRVKKSILAATIKKTITLDLLAGVKHGSLKTLQRVFGYCFRFINNCKAPKGSRTTGTLTITELDRALLSLIRNAQQIAYPEEHLYLKQGKQLGPTNPLQSLSPFWDNENELIRVGGRLRHSNLDTAAKSQMLLPKNHPLSEIILSHLHTKHMHASPQTLVAILRQRYWILDARKLARSVVRKCIQCFRCKPTEINQMMGDLPKERVQPARPFSTTGIDFCGPIMIHHSIRGKRPTKAYISVFVCFTTRAIHLELVSDLTTSTFLNALKRFISRRGLCHTIYCDNATNFMGARSELSELRNVFNTSEFQSSVSKLCSENRIIWKPIPPRSPHFGGLWEAAVKSAKYHLVRQVGNASLTHEELYTIITQVEAVLNSRPLTPMSADPNDLEVLTPGHFLIGGPLTSYPEPDVSDKNINHLTRFRRLQHIQQNFWKRWSTEYLQELQARNKWATSQPNIRKGTLVLLKDKNIPPLNWILGRVIETTSGPDGLIRVASVKTKSGVFKRAIHNLCPLPIEGDLEVRQQETSTGTKSTTAAELTTGSASPTKAGPSTSSSLTAAANPNPTVLQATTKEPNKLAEKSQDYYKVKRMKGKRVYHPNRGRFLPINPAWLSRPAVQNEASLDNQERPPTPQKRRGQSPVNSALKVLLLTALILPVMGQPLNRKRTEIEPVEVTRFSTPPRVYFDALGQVKLIRDEWNLVVFYNMDYYWKEMETIEWATKRLRNLCQCLSDLETYCIQVLGQLEHQIQTLNYYNQLLISSNKGSEQRERRSPLNIVGTIANKLFGILDEEYAAKLENTIKNVHENQDYLLSLIKNQTSVIESTVNIIHRDEEFIEQYTSLIGNLTTYEQRVNDSLQEHYLMQTFNTLATYVNIIINNYQRTQTTLTDVLTDTHNGKVSHLLIRPEQLKRELHVILKNLPADTVMPEQYDEDNVLRFYHLMTVKGRVMQNSIIFNIKLPLLHNEYYEIFRIIAIPALNKASFNTIDSSVDNLAISLHRDQYYPLTNEELSRCLLWEANVYLCQQQHAIFTKESQTHNCEISLFNKEEPRSCRFKKMDPTPWWYNLSNGNRWLYSLLEETTLTIVCGTRVIQKTLDGQGILNLKTSCTIRQDTLMMNSHRIYTSKLNTSFASGMNITLLTRGSADEKLHSHEITVVQEELKKLKEREHLPKQLSEHDIHQYSIAYLALLSVIIAALVAIIMKIRQHLQDRKPTPAPRLKREDFNLDHSS